MRCGPYCLLCPRSPGFVSSLPLPATSLPTPMTNTSGGSSSVLSARDPPGQSASGQAPPTAMTPVSIVRHFRPLADMPASTMHAIRPNGTGQRAITDGTSGRRSGQPRRRRGRRCEPGQTRPTPTKRCRWRFCLTQIISRRMIVNIPLNSFRSPST